MHPTLHLLERSVPAPSPRLLLVSPDASICRLVTWMLRATYQVATVATGEQALAAMTTCSYDRVLVDVNLRHGMPARAFLEAVRSREPGLPVLVLSPFVSPLAARQYRRTGFDGYVPRPFDKETLQTSLRDVCRRPTPLRSGRLERCELPRKPARLHLLVSPTLPQGA